MSGIYGLEPKATCNRKGCKGIIEQHMFSIASAKIRIFCDTCGWQRSSDYVNNKGYVIWANKKNEVGMYTNQTDGLVSF